MLKIYTESLPVSKGHVVRFALVKIKALYCRKEHKDRKLSYISLLCFLFKCCTPCLVCDSKECDTEIICVIFEQ